MATKKLTVEVDADVRKANAKVKSIGAGLTSGGGGDTVSQAAQKVAQNLDKASKRLDTFGSSVGRSASTIGTFVKGFAGVGAGLAMSYAQNVLPHGPARTAMGYGANMLSGGAMGAAVGSVVPGIGTLIGGLVGAGLGAAKSAVDNYGEKKNASTDWEDSERHFRSSKDFAAQITRLNTIKKDRSDLDAKLKEAEASLAKYQSVEPQLVRNVNQFIANGQYDLAARQRTELDINRSSQDQLQNTIKSLKALSEDKPITPRSDPAALDSLSRIGGYFASSGGSGLDRLEANGKDQLTVLKQIERKTGGASWQ